MKKFGSRILHGLIHTEKSSQFGKNEETDAECEPYIPVARTTDGKDGDLLVRTKLANSDACISNKRVETFGKQREKIGSDGTAKSSLSSANNRGSVDFGRTSDSEDARARLEKTKGGSNWLTDVAEQLRTKSSLKRKNSCKSRKNMDARTQGKLKAVVHKYSTYDSGSQDFLGTTAVSDCMEKTSCVPGKRGANAIKENRGHDNEERGFYGQPSDKEKWFAGKENKRGSPLGKQGEEFVHVGVNEASKREKERCANNEIKPDCLGKVSKENYGLDGEGGNLAASIPASAKCLETDCHGERGFNVCCENDTGNGRVSKGNSVEHGCGGKGSIGNSGKRQHGIKYIGGVSESATACGIEKESTHTDTVECSDSESYKRQHNGTSVPCTTNNSRAQSNNPSRYNTQPAQHDSLISFKQHSHSSLEHQPCLEIGKTASTNSQLPSPNSSTELSLIERKYKDASTNTEISLVPPFPDIISQEFSPKPDSPQAEDQLSTIPLNNSLNAISINNSSSFINATDSQVNYRPRRDWSKRYLKERPISLNGHFHRLRDVNEDPILGKAGRRNCSSTKRERVVTPNTPSTSRYALSSRASSTDRFLDDKDGPELLLESSSQLRSLTPSILEPKNGYRSFFSASEASLLDDGESTLSLRPRERIRRLKDDSGDTPEARFVTNETFYQNRTRSSSNDGLLRQSTLERPKAKLSSSGNERQFGSQRLKDHKYHRSECNLIQNCNCENIPNLRTVCRTRTTENVGRNSRMSKFPEFYPEHLPKSKSTSGSIFLKQVVEPSKAFAYLTSIDTLTDGQEQSKRDPMGSSFSRLQSEKSYEPLCQNCGLKGHSILKCDRISRVDKLYDVIMLGDRVTITHNEPNYVRSQRNKLPRCYHCGLKGHRSRSCSKILGPQLAKPEVDPFASSPKDMATFSAFTLPRTSRRARSEGRSELSFTVAASADEQIDCQTHPHDTSLSLMHSPVSTDRSYKPSSDFLFSDTDYGYDSGAYNHRPVSMFESISPSRQLNGGPHTFQKRPTETLRGKLKTLKIEENNRSNLQSSPKNLAQKRNTVDFDDRDSGIGYGETSSQCNYETYSSRNPHTIDHSTDAIEPVFPAHISTLADSPRPASDISESDGAKKPDKPKKKNAILRKFASIKGHKNTSD